MKCRSVLKKIAGRWCCPSCGSPLHAPPVNVPGTLFAGAAIVTLWSLAVASFVGLFKLVSWAVLS